MSRVVAPYAGAWIEIYIPNMQKVRFDVAPYAGAWIEIVCICCSNGSFIVAPYAGAWIEMMNMIKRKLPKMSHPTRVRGLK